MSKQQRKPAQMPDPNQRQVGGDHYRTEFQHWDFVESMGMGYLEGCATKYIDRHSHKNGVEDLRKACHYVEKIIALAKQGRPNPLSRLSPGFGAITSSLGKFLQSRERQPWESKCIKRLTIWVGIDDLEYVVGQLSNEIAALVAEEEEEDFENVQAHRHIRRGSADADADGEAGPGYVNQD